MVVVVGSGAQGAKLLEHFEDVRIDVGGEEERFQSADVLEDGGVVGQKHVLDSKLREPWRK